MAQRLLQIDDLQISVKGTPIIQGLSFEVKGGEVHAVLGPRGAGKSTFANALMGHPLYEVTSGRVTWDGKDLLKMRVDERARDGLFLAMQEPVEIAGVSNANLLRLAINARRGTGHALSVLQFHRQLHAKLKELGMEQECAERCLNVGLSGGEKRRNEILQMVMLKPRLAILDEIDFGLDLEVLNVVTKAVHSMRTSEMAIVIIPHEQRLLHELEPDHVHVLLDGRIVRSGGMELAAHLDEEGYDWIRDEVTHEEEGCASSTHPSADDPPKGGVSDDGR